MRLVGLISVLTMVVMNMALAANLEILLMSEPFPGTDSEFSTILKKTMEGSGYKVTAVDAGSLTASLAGNSENRKLLIYPNAAWVPFDAKEELVDYLKSGGNLLIIGGPLFSKQAVKLNGEWLTQQMLREKLAVSPPGDKLINMGAVDPASIISHSGVPPVKLDFKIVQSDREGGPVLEVHAPKVESWANLRINIQKPFPVGEGITTFWAKSDGNLKQINIDWADAGVKTRRARIDLTTSWKRYVLFPEDFGGEGSSPLAPQKVRQFIIGFEGGHLNDKTRQSTFWISSLHSVPVGATNLDFSQPTLETLSPVYKTYTTTASAYVPTFGSYANLTEPPAFEGTVKTVCSLPRPRGMGFNREMPRRWIPALAVRMDDGHIGGAAAAYFVQDDKIYQGSVWASFGIEDSKFLATNREKIARQVAAMVKRIDDGVFLLSGGVDRAACFDDIPNAGGVVLNLGGSHETFDIECRISPENKPAVFSMKEKAVLSGKRTVVEFGPVKNLSPGFYIAETSLYKDGKLIDQIRQPFSIVAKGVPVPESERVTIQGDQFYYKGKPWYSLGINYRPLYAAALESGPFWDHFTHPHQYDPEICEMDLDLMTKIGINTVALIMYPDDRIPGMIDFLERAHRRGIKCHMFLGGLHPLNINRKLALEQIEGVRLWERPAMFAYDVGWEVRVGRYEQREKSSRHWKRWLEDRYGSVEYAEKDWGYTLEKEPDGTIHGPADQQLEREGPWNRMVAAYRRFWDDRISRKYMEVARLVDSVDPYHPISARSGWGGTGVMHAVSQFPFDLASGAKHLDYISPEGYNFIGQWPEFRSFGFTTLYGKFVSNGKPVYWAELGRSMHVVSPTDEQLQAALEKQRLYYENFYKVMCETRSAGTAAWWWPGYLISERSDYAVINPDYTVRPAANEFLKMSKIEPAPAKSPDYWIEIDRDEHITGYAGILWSKRMEYAKAVANGKTVGLRTRGTGTDTSNFPEVAVGNTPLNSHNPPKYLNAEFNSLEILDVNGKWVSVEDGADVKVKAGAPVFARASLGNIAETKWLAPKRSKSGGVFLKAEINGNRVLAPIKADTPFFADAEVEQFKLSDSIVRKTQVSFQMITSEFVFGEKIYITLVTP